MIYLFWVLRMENKFINNQNNQDSSVLTSDTKENNNIIINENKFDNASEIKKEVKQNKFIIKQKKVKQKKIKEEKIKEKKVIVKEPFSFKIFIFNLLLFVFIVFFGAKAYILYNYSVSDENVATNDFIVLYKTIYSKTSIDSIIYSESEYYTFNNVSIYNFLNNYSLTNKTNNYVEYTLYDSSNNILNIFSITVNENYIYNIKDQTLDKTINYYELLTLDNSELVVAEFLNTYEINNVYDLINYLETDIETNILDNLQSIKDNYSVSYLFDLYQIEENTTLIEGKYNGYKTISGDSVKYTFYNEEYTYTFSFSNSSYYETDILLELMGSIILK